MEKSLSELIDQAKSGNKEAFGQIYKLFLQRIYRYIRYQVSNSEEAEDLTQTTFLKVWKSLGSFTEKGGSFQAYLFTIARNLIIDFWRKKKEVSLDKIEVETNEDILGEVIRKQEKERTWLALSKLDDFDRQIIILRYFEDLSFIEISSILNKKEVAIRVRTHRILKKLKQILEN